jgi:hypothetical protein
LTTRRISTIAVFEPYASSAQRDFVEDIINRRNVAITGHDQ